MGRRIGNYEAGETIGRGGMGAVLRARHVELGAIRALKVMARPDNPKSLARFEREVQSLAGISHPNVVRIHEAGVHGGEPWFAMDLIEGQPLDARLTEGDPLPWREAVEIAVGICRGVHALHEHGVIHRDLKPANIMLDSQGRPVVIDLGLAIAPERDQRLTKTGALLGTLNYMAPEQFTGGRPTPRTDVYALGLITFELLTGVPAVPVKDSIHSQAKAILEARVLPSSLDPEIPASLDRLCMRALAQQPERRPPDAGAMADALEAVLATPGISGAHERYRKYTFATLALAILLAVAIGGAFVFKSRTTDALPQPAATPRPATTSRSNARDEERARRAASAELRGYLSTRNERQKLSHLERWLAENPDHPERAKAMEARDRVLMSGPLLTFTHSGMLSAALTRTHVLTAGTDKRIRLWDLKTGAESMSIALPWVAHGIAATPDGRRAVVRGVAAFRVYDLTTGQPLAEQRWAAPLAQVGIDPSGHRIVVADHRERFGVRLLAMPELTPVAEASPTRAEVVVMAFSADGNHLVVGCAKSDKGGQDGAALWDFSGPGPPKEQLGVREITRCHAVAVDAAGTRIAVGTAMGHLILTSSAGERRLRGKDLQLPAMMDEALGDIEFAHGGSTKGVAFSPDGRRLYSVAGRVDDEGGEVRTWDVERGEELQDGPGQPVLPAQWPLPLSGVAVSADERRLLVWSISPHDTAQLWALPERP